MPIIASELVIFGCEAMDDTATGGGRRGSSALVTGAANNVWPDVTTDDALAGRTKVRKLYPSVVDDGAALLQSASFMLNAPASDPLVSVCLAAYGNDAAQRSEFEANALSAPTQITNLVTFSGGGVVSFSGTIDGGSTALTLAASTRDAINTNVRQGGLTPGYLVLRFATGVHVAPLLTISPGAVSPSSEQTYTLAKAFPGVATGVAVTVSAFYFPAGAKRFFGVAPLRVAPSAGNTVLQLTHSLAQVCPTNGGSATLANRGFAPTPLNASAGQAPVLVAGDTATLCHEDATTPGTRSNGNVINVGRTNLSQMALVDNNGAEIGRVLAGGPSGPASFTVDLAAGTLTCNDVSGWAQPVYVRHRISERVVISAAEPSQVTLAAGISRDYPSGSFLTTELPLGDLQPTVGVRLFQQAWTRVWSDTVIGASAGTLYMGDITLQAGGAENDRYACVFSSATQYTLHSERWGVIGTGNIGTDYVPLNPATGQPLLTLLATGWVPGSIALGNVFRFNVRGAYAPVWALQCIQPGATVGNASAPLLMRGSVDA